MMKLVQQDLSLVNHREQHAWRLQHELGSLEVYQVFVRDDEIVDMAFVL